MSPLAIQVAYSRYEHKSSRTDQSCRKFLKQVGASFGVQFCLAHLIRDAQYARLLSERDAAVAERINFPGAWLYSSGHPVLHLNDISQTEKQHRADSGVIDHVAFGCRGFEAARRHLSEKGVPYQVNQVLELSRAMLKIPEAVVAG
jgi:hypothetical protein